MRFTHILATGVLLVGGALALPLAETDVSLAAENPDALHTKRTDGVDLSHMFKGGKGCHGWKGDCKDDGKYKHVCLDKFNLLFLFLYCGHPV